MRVRLQFYATVLCVAGILLGMVCKMFFPEYWFGLYPLILVAYWLMEMIMSFVAGKYEGHMSKASLEGGKWMKIYMICKLVKVVMTLGLILVGLFLSDGQTQKVLFAVCAVVFYLANLAVETYVITKR